MKRRAVLIGSGTFSANSGLSPLRCPGTDVRGIERALRSPDIGEFEQVVVALDRPHYEVKRMIHGVLRDAERDDVVLIYFSGHGKLSASGKLYLTSADTTAGGLESTALSAEDIRGLIKVERSRRVVVLLDCCYGGAASDGFKGGELAESARPLGGTGTVLITAANSLELAVERAEDENSLFTKHLLAGIESGAADRNRDGLIDVDELYDYVKEHVEAETGGMSPTKSDFDIHGEIFIAKSGQYRRKKLKASLRRWNEESLIGNELLKDGLDLLDRPEAWLPGALRDRLRIIEELDRQFDSDLRLEWERLLASRTGQRSKVIEITGILRGLRRLFYGVTSGHRYLESKFASFVVVFLVGLVNYVQTSREPSLAKQSPLEFKFAAAMLEFEGSSIFSPQAKLPPTVSIALCAAYFLLLPVLLSLELARAARAGAEQLRIFALAIAIAYLSALPFFVYFPVPERWTLDASGATLLSDSVSAYLMAGIRPISAVDNSFPSFHVTLSTLVAGLAFWWRTSSRFAVLLSAVAIVLATYLLGVHWLADIVAGVGCGLLSVAAALKLSEFGTTYLASPEPKPPGAPS